MKLRLSRRFADERAAARAERDVRAQFFHHARAHTPIVAVEHEGLRFLLSTADGGLGLRFFAKRRRRDARTLRRALARLDARGLGEHARERAFLDVGANVGTACLVAVGAAGFRRAIALEPEPENFSLLRANLALNFLDDRVDAHQLAAAQTSGPVELALSKGSSGSHRLFGPAEGSKETIEVEAVSLDGLLDRLGLGSDDIGLVWIDVNGLEPQVLAGSERLLKARVPVVFEASRSLMPLPPLVMSYSGVADLRTRNPDLPVGAIDDVVARLSTGRRTETDILLIP